MIKELITESKREHYFARLYIDVELFKKQRLQHMLLLGVVGLLVSSLILFVGGFSLIGLFVSLFLILTFAYVGYKLPYYSMLDLASSEDARIGVIFPEFLQVFMGMLEVSPTSGVLQALKMTIPYIKNPVKVQVLRLVYEISANGSTPNVRRSLQEFGDYIGSVDAQRILDIIFTMYEDGVDPRTLESAAEKIDELNQNTVDAYVEAKKKSMRSRALPALILGVVFIFAFIGVLVVQYLQGAFSM